MRSKKTIKGLYDLCDSLRDYLPIKDLAMVELGCYKGDSTEVWAQNFGNVYAIDPWECGYDDKDGASVLNGSAIEAEFDRRMSIYRNVTKLKGFSFEAAEKFSDASISFVYIDAEHTYEAVRRDIGIWLPKIQEQGFIGGHDYKKKWPGVIRALDECFGHPDQVFSDSSYLIELNPSLTRNIKAQLNAAIRKVKDKWG